MNILFSILFAAFLAGLSTCLGAVLVLVWGRLGRRSFSLFTGLAAGVMLAVVLLDLLPASLHYGSIIQVISGFAAGTFLMVALDLILQRENQSPKLDYTYLKMGYLIAAGIALHDLPEGLAIAAGFIEPGHLGPLIALAIALHNIPEGMATAAPLAAGGFSPLLVLFINGLVSLVTPLGCWIGLLLTRTSTAVLSSLLALAAGAMAYIVITKLLPECLRLHPPTARLGLAGGFTLVLFLNLFL
ncbi:ZIP family metal transporter [Desulfofundulus australicus]|uniref:ZIP family metal transporter n=1 Tax=Desulfofundulus australicus TaxID=1566 RepID=UPI001F614FCB|nr:ZIP family metal transporter [Desulfofundulus australicus]